MLYSGSFETMAVVSWCESNWEENGSRDKVCLLFKRVSNQTSTFITRPTICLYRVNNYIENGLSKDKEDPDGGVNLAKKKKKLGAADEVDPELNEKFPCYGFQCGISELPRISFGHIWKYLIEEVDLRKKSSTGKTDCERI